MLAIFSLWQIPHCNSGIEGSQVGQTSRSDQYISRQTWRSGATTELFGLRQGEENAECPGATLMDLIDRCGDEIRNKVDFTAALILSLN